MARFPKAATLLPSATRTGAAANVAGTAVTNLANLTRAALLLDVTATAGGAGDVLNVYVDVLAPDGVTWLNACHFTTVAGDSAAIKHYATLDATAVAATTFDVSADCASGVTKPYLWGSSMRGRYTTTNAGASVTFSLSALIQ